VSVIMNLRVPEGGWGGVLSSRAIISLSRKASHNSDTRIVSFAENACLGICVLINALVTLPPASQTVWSVLSCFQ
jgi:hypothetical protein